MVQQNDTQKISVDWFVHAHAVVDKLGFGEERVLPTTFGLNKKGGMNSQCFLSTTSTRQSRIQISCSALEGMNPTSRSTLNKCSCQRRPELLSPYNALRMTRVCPCRSPNSGPAMMSLKENATKVVANNIRALLLGANLPIKFWLCAFYFWLRIDNSMAS